MKKHSLLLGTVFTMGTTVATMAVSFDYIRIGDADGFGISPTPDLLNAEGSPADTNGNGTLEAGEFLPDWNGSGGVLIGSFDDFDNRSANELANTSVTGSGFADTGSQGSKWTDVSLSTSYGAPNSAIASNLPLMPFPDSAGPQTPNEPVFNYRFDVAKTDIDFGSKIFFNIIFGDYDVAPARIDVRLNGGSVLSLPLIVQSLAEDGLIQAATVSLDFEDVFSEDAGGLLYNGFLDVLFVAEKEPYTAWDFTELSLVSAVPTPEAGHTLLLLGIAMAGLFVTHRRLGIST